MRQKLGQHFLTNRSFIKKIIDELDLKSGETVVEIGAGHGELTLPLAEACKETGCKVVAVEKDKSLADELEIITKNSGKRVEIIHDDALAFMKSLSQFSILDLKSYKISGNLPYYITGQILRILGELEYKPKLCVLMVQKEVAERLTAKPPKMNRLAASVQFWAESKIVSSVSKKNFNPPPEVDSAIIKLKVKDEIQKNEAVNYYRMVKIIFQQPRKTILNNLFHGNLKVDKNFILTALKKTGLEPKIRPQDLSIQNIIELAAIFRAQQ